MEGVRIASAFHYGAVEVDPTLLVVWLLLDGRPDEKLPEWLTISPGLVESQRPADVDHDWLFALREEVHEIFRAAGWPAHGPVVMVDSQHRVDAAGGWNYFR